MDYNREMDISLVLFEIHMQLNIESEFQPFYYHSIAV